MIKAATIRNYKCFEELVLPRLSRITLVGGANNVGKSALLEALFFFFDIYNPKGPIRHYAWRGIGETSVDAEFQLKEISNNFDATKPPEIEVQYLNDEKVILTTSLTTHEPLKQNEEEAAGVVSTDSPPLRPTALKMSYTGSERFKTSYSIFANRMSSIEGRIAVPKTVAFHLNSRGRVKPEQEAERFGKVEREGGLEKLIKIIQVIEPRLTDLATIISNNKAIIHADIGLAQKIPVPLMGDGVDRLLSIMLAMSNYPDGIMLVDECENGFHYSMHTKVWQAIAEASKQLNCQVIATTHSYEFLSAAHEGTKGGHEAEFEFVRLERTHQEKIEAKIFDHELLGDALAASMEVR